VTDQKSKFKTHKRILNKIHIKDQT